MRERVEAHNCALGSSVAEVMFTGNLDSCNHVVDPDYPENDADYVEMRTLDEFWPNQMWVLKPGASDIEMWPKLPEMTVIKVDVEGFEKDVMDGGPKVFSKAHAVIIELLNGSGTRYGYDDWELHKRMLDMGFRLHRYDPFTRELRETDEIIGGNNLYVRDAEFVRERLKTAPIHWVHERMI
jgi:FkbM family methyltransferase